MSKRTENRDWGSGGVVVGTVQLTTRQAEQGPHQVVRRQGRACSGWSWEWAVDATRRPETRQAPRPCPHEEQM